MYGTDEDHYSLSKVERGSKLETMFEIDTKYGIKPKQNKNVTYFINKQIQYKNIDLKEFKICIFQ